MIVLRRINVNNKAVWALSKKTGLRFQTVRNLLVNGWSYEEKIDCVPRWVHPSAQLPILKE